MSETTTTTTTTKDGPLPKRYLLDAILGGVIIVILADTVWQIRELDSDASSSTNNGNGRKTISPEVRKEQLRMLSVGITTSFSAAWPIVWQHLVGWDVLAHNPVTLFGFLWPLVMSMIDVSYTSHSSSTIDPSRFYGLNGQVTADANTLLGVSFAVGSLLISQVRSGISEATIPLLMYALLLLIAFIVPTPSLDPQGFAGFAVATTQRNFFNWAMGFVITGISVNLSEHGHKGMKRALCNDIENRAERHRHRMRRLTNRDSAVYAAHAVPS